jgi:hypothetical protein
MVKDKTESFIATLTLDEAGEARAQIALALAGKLDQAAKSDSAGVAQSVAGISRELRDTLDQLSLSQGERQAFVAELFAA